MKPAADLEHVASHRSLLSLFVAFEVRINNLLPSPGLSLSPSAPGCARHSGKKLWDGAAAPALLDAPTPLASLSLLPSPPAPGPLSGGLEKRKYHDDE